ncbi:MAG: hydrolase [Arenicellales bacterium WSBS_2016_MAG_OTU3]
MPQTLPTNSDHEAVGRITRSDFNPPWWASNPHWQTLVSYQFQHHPKPDFDRERLELRDGDFLDLDWLPVTDENSNQNSDDTPLILLIHGLVGSSKSHYCRNLCHHLQQNGIDSVVMNLRGCSGEPNRLAIGYHSGKTDDVDFVLNELKQRYPNKPLFAIGFSLGGNILLKWLAEKQNNLLHAAVAVSVPFDLGLSANRLNRGFSRLYQKRLLVLMRHYILLKKALLEAANIDISNIKQCKNFRMFDNAYTAPLHGFINAEDYYTRASSKPIIKDIQTPTLILHSEDDPFVDHASIPKQEELSPYVTLELSTHGGHIGFSDMRNPFKPKFWLENRIRQFISEAITPIGSL